MPSIIKERGVLILFRALLSLTSLTTNSRVMPYLCLLNGEDPLSQEMEPQDCKVVRLGVRSLRRPLTIVKLLQFARQLRRWRIDVLQVHFPDSTYFGVAAGALARIPRLVRTRRDLFYWTSSLQRKYGRIIDGMYNRYLVDAMITNSHACRRAAIESERHIPQNIVVIDNGIDVSLFFKCI